MIVLPAKDQEHLPPELSQLSPCNVYFHTIRSQKRTEKRDKRIYTRERLTWRFSFASKDAISLKV